MKSKCLLVIAIICLFDLIQSSDTGTESGALIIDDFQVGFEGNVQVPTIQSKSHNKHKKKQKFRKMKMNFKKIEKDVEDVSKKLFKRKRKHRHHKKGHKGGIEGPKYFKDQAGLPFMMRAVIPPGEGPLPPLHFEFKENNRNCRCRCKI